MACCVNWEMWQKCVLCILQWKVCVATLSILYTGCTGEVDRCMVFKSFTHVTPAHVHVQSLAQHTNIQPLVLTQSDFTPNPHPENSLGLDVPKMSPHNRTSVNKRMSPQHEEYLVNTHTLRLQEFRAGYTRTPLNSTSWLLSREYLTSATHSS